MSLVLILDVLLSIFVYFHSKLFIFIVLLVFKTESNTIKQILGRVASAFFFKQHIHKKIAAIVCDKALALSLTCLELQHRYLPLTSALLHRLAHLRLL